jgi:hypothetical protein
VDCETPEKVKSILAHFKKESFKPSILPYLQTGINKLKDNITGMVQYMFPNNEDPSKLDVVVVEEEQHSKTSREDEEAMVQMALYESQREYHQKVKTEEEFAKQESLASPSQVCVKTM